ncbi:MAG: hypothetical protein IJ708_01695, partial [Clostridia bacterium]|nr:hypothetical protein [Clostridia bacterium]
RLMRIAEDSRIASVACADREEQGEEEASPEEGIPTEENFQEADTTDSDETIQEPVLNPDDAVSDLDMDLPGDEEMLPEDDL